MRTYLILKEKAAQFNEDEEIQALLAEIRADNGGMTQFNGGYTREKADALKVFPFNRQEIAGRGMGYERLDQLVIELLLGVR
jgi:xylose isomerase